MTFSKPFTDLEKIQLLQRSILVNSYAYYELDESIISDFQYDANTRQLLELKESNPEAYKKSRYYRYFDNFESGTGFDLTSRIRKNKKLYNKVARDAELALKLKKEHLMK
jgi:NAD-dependent DNA ligase